MKKLQLLAVVCLLALSASAQISISVPNDTTTGTTLNKLAKFNTTGSATSVIITATTDTSGVIGIITAGAGTSNVAILTVSGVAPCVFDNSTTPNDYVQISGSTAGDCHDAGSTRPTSGQILGTVFGAGGSAGTYNVSLNKDIYPSSSSSPSNVQFSSGGTLTNSGTSFVAMGFTSATEAGNQIPISHPGTVSNLQCRVGTALSGSQTFTLTVRQGSASTGAITSSSTTVTCTLNSTNTQGCSDTTHSFAANAGDVLGIQVVAANTPSGSNLNCSVQLQ